MLFFLFGLFLSLLPSVDRSVSLPLSLSLLVFSLASLISCTIILISPRRKASADDLIELLMLVSVIFSSQLFKSPPLLSLLFFLLLDKQLRNSIRRFLRIIQNIPKLRHESQRFFLEKSTQVDMHLLSIRSLAVSYIVIQQTDHSATDNIILLPQESKNSLLDPYFNQLNVNFVQVNLSVVLVRPLAILQHALCLVRKTRVLVVGCAFHYCCFRLLSSNSLNQFSKQVDIVCYDKSIQKIIYHILIVSCVSGLRIESFWLLSSKESFKSLTVINSEELTSIFWNFPKNIQHENPIATKDIKKTQKVSLLYPRPRFSVDSKAKPATIGPNAQLNPTVLPITPHPTPK